MKKIYYLLTTGLLLCGVSCSMFEDIVHPTKPSPPQKTIRERLIGTWQHYKDYRGDRKEFVLVYPVTECDFRTFYPDATAKIMTIGSKSNYPCFQNISRSDTKWKVQGDTLLRTFIYPHPFYHEEQLKIIEVTDNSFKATFGIDQGSYYQIDTLYFQRVN
jgi:hypothetical protein